MSLRLPNGSYTVTPGGFGPTQQQKQPTQQPTFGSPAQTSQQAWGQEQAAAKTSKSSGVDMSAYKPSQAQPLQQSQGTAYGAYVNKDGQRFLGTQSYAPGTSQEYINKSYGDWANREGYYQQPPPPATGPGGRPIVYQDGVAGYMDFGSAGHVPPGMFGTLGGSGFTPLPQGGGQQPSTRPPVTQVTGDPRGGYAAAPPDQRPPPFYAAPAQTPWGQSMDPGAEMYSLTEQLNKQRMQRQIDFNNNSGARPSTWGGSPTLDFGAAMNGAGLGNGAPSMSPDYGDSLIGRLNEQFGGGAYRPDAQAQLSQHMLAPPRHMEHTTTVGPDGSQHTAYTDYGPAQPQRIPQEPTYTLPDDTRTQLADSPDFGNRTQQFNGDQGRPSTGYGRPFHPQPNPGYGYGLPAGPPILRPYDERPKGGRAQPVQPPSQGSPYGPSTGYLSDSEMQEMRSYNNNTATPDQRNRQNELIALRQSRADAAPEYRQRQSDLMAKRQAVDAYRSKEHDHRQAYYDATRAQQDMNRRLGIGPTYNPSTNGSLYPKLKGKGMRKGGGGQMR